MQVGKESCVSDTARVHANLNIMPREKTVNIIGHNQIITLSSLLYSYKG